MFIENGKPKACTKFIDLVYPVGSIYMSVNTTNPNTLFGGTWQKLKDRFLLGSGDYYSSGSKGGESAHTLTIDEMPSHTHAQYSHTHNLYSNDTWGDASVGFYQNSSNNSGISTVKNGRNAGTKSYYNRTLNDATQLVQDTTAVNQNTGGSLAHNNMPPYLVVNIWKRTA